MVAEEWIRSQLSSKVVGDNITLAENTGVSISTFCTFFRAAIEDETKPDKYVALSGSHTFLWGNPPQEHTKTAAQLGYQPYFDQWHVEGLI